MRSSPTCLQELGTSKEQQANGSKGPATIAVGQQVEPFISGTFEYGLGRPASRTHVVACTLHAWNCFGIGAGYSLQLIELECSLGLLCHYILMQHLCMSCSALLTGMSQVEAACSGQSMLASFELGTMVS